MVNCGENSIKLLLSTTSRHNGFTFWIQFHRLRYYFSYFFFYFRVCQFLCSLQLYVSISPWWFLLWSSVRKLCYVYWRVIEIDDNAIKHHSGRSCWRGLFQQKGMAEIATRSWFSAIFLVYVCRLSLISTRKGRSKKTESKRSTKLFIAPTFFTLEAILR